MVITEKHDVLSSVGTAILCLGIVGYLGAKISQLYRKFRFFRSLPSLGYSPLYGNLNLMPKTGDDLQELGRRMAEEAHPKLCVLWMSPVRPVVCVYHPDTARPVYTSSVAHKIRGRWQSYELLVPWIGEGLVTANGQTWSRFRKLLNPAFHANILRNYMGIYNQCAEKLIIQLDELAETGESFDLFPLITKTTLEIIMKCIMGYDADVIGYREGYHPYAKAVLELSEDLLTRFWSPRLWEDWFFYWSATGKKFRKNCDFVHKVAEEIIEKRKEMMDNGEVSPGKHMDFIDIMLSARDEDDQPMTSLEIRHQVDTFMFAGHDTTASGLSFNLYNLAKHQDYQHKVQQEVDQVLEGRDYNEILWEDLSHLKMLQLCSKESLRLFTPVQSMPRILTRDLLVEGVTIPAGTQISVFSGTMHANREVWDRPREYIPERFLADDIDTFAFLPFSAGHRNCIGQNFTVNEEKVIVSRILQRYNIRLASGYKGPKLTLGTIIKSSNGIMLTVHRR